jgi:hypothetical protein
MRHSELPSLIKRLIALLALLLPALLAAAPVELGFADAAELRAWQVTGTVALDAERDRQGAGGISHALRLAPGSQAVLPLRPESGSGTVSLWVYDDGTVPADPKVRRGGPQWGLLQPDGRALILGHLYAPYLTGEQTYTVADYLPASEKPWFSVQFVGQKRVEGWHQWEFRCDAQAGLSLRCDGKPVGRFNWNTTKFTGFSGVILLGDDPAGKPQTLWVDDLRVELGGPMVAKPVPPPPPPPAVPEQDPALEGAAAELLPAVRGVHPRLLFGPDELTALRAKASLPVMKRHWDDLLAYLPSCTVPENRAFLTDATDGQRQGLWRMPTLGLHYVLTGDRASLDRAVAFMQMLLALPNWETTSERDAGMSSANVLVGAALCYDWLYHDLEPAFREQFRRKLVYMARAQYHGGHLNQNKSNGYWQGDPQNNHRWHRNAGLTLAILAASEGKPEEQWILTKTREDLDYVARWLPPDGTSHESPTYLTFGLPHLTLAFQAADRCLGTQYLDLPFCREVVKFRVHSFTPGLADGFQFGDSVGIGGYFAALWLYTGRHQLAHEQAALERVLENAPKSFEFGWWNLLWRDPQLTGGDVAKLPTTAFYPDLGLLYVRDTWAAGGVAALFKCGPLGGYTLNRYRNEQDFKYVNVAHDDPDANSFTLFSQGAFLAETDRYSEHKRSAQHNTILVNGKGQRVAGRPEGLGFTQPASGKTDMTQMAVVTALVDTGEVVIVEGEAAGAYPELDRFRRTFIWVKGQYLLILDDIRAPREVDLTWLLQGPQLTAVQAPAHAAPVAGAADDAAVALADEETPVITAVNTYLLAKGEAVCPVAIVADRPFTGAIGESPADNKKQPLGWQQLQLRTRGKTWRVISLYDPWRQGDLKLALATTARDAATVTVTGAKLTDTWQWQAATGRFTPSTLTGRAKLDATSLPPQP